MSILSFEKTISKFISYNLLSSHVLIIVCVEFERELNHFFYKTVLCLVSGYSTRSSVNRKTKYIMFGKHFLLPIHHTVLNLCSKFQ